MARTRSAVTAGRIALALALACVSWAAFGGKDKAFADWYDGAEGYRTALALQESTGKPLLVYFRAPWCHYCASVDKSVFRDPAVAETVAGMIGVRIYGEDGKAEKRLMAKFGARVYPSIFLKADARSKFRKVDVFDAEGNILPPARFLEVLTGAGAPSARR